MTGPGAVLVGHAASALSRRLGRGGGTVIAGHIVPRLAPDALARLSHALPGGTVLRDEPNGRIIAFLPDSAPLQILYRTAVVNEIVWVEVRDVLNRVGWVRESHIERASP